jgi:hypothetical protein
MKEPQQHVRCTAAWGTVKSWRRRSGAVLLPGQRGVPSLTHEAGGHEEAWAVRLNRCGGVLML